MTNPDAAGSGRPRIFYPSRSPEGELVERLFGDRPIPEGFDLVDEVAARVDAGTLSLAPRDDSGWYDHQLWSLEPLVAWDRTPEAARVDATAAYRAHLRDVFRALFALTRETHVKQLMPAVAGGRPPERIGPDIVTEPLATMYARRADSYAFVREVLREAIGPSFHDVVGDSIDRIETLLRGSAAAVVRDIGDASASDEPSGAEKTFRDWAARAHTDADLAADPRMMVPVFFDLQRKKTKVWAVLGWSHRFLRVSYAKTPRVLAGDVDEHTFGDSHPMAFYPVTVELYVTQIRTREEMRQICDTHRERASIIAALESG
jgi:hypothetical protein